MLEDMAEMGLHCLSIVMQLLNALETSLCQLLLLLLCSCNTAEGAVQV